MALDGIGGGSPLERFQAIRDSAKKKIEGTAAQSAGAQGTAAQSAGGQANLADLIKRKQAQWSGKGGANGTLGTEVGGGASSPTSGNAAKASAERIRPGLGAANGAFGAANGAFGTANGAFGTANGAFGTANGAFGTANGAFGAAIGAFGAAGIGLEGSASAGSQALSGPTGYGRAGALQKQESRPTLGRHVDFMA